MEQSIKDNQVLAIGKVFDKFGRFKYRKQMVLESETTYCKFCSNGFLNYHTPCPECETTKRFVKNDI